MKLILKQYLASLKERSELDAVLPDLLSNMGMNVFIYPTRGFKEYGVDIAAVGRVNGGEEKVYLFSVKSGNLTRETWSGASSQSLLPSLNEIMYGFIPSRIPPEHNTKPIVICLCFGGDINSGIRQEVAGFETINTKGSLSFEEWNGDKLADLIQVHLLKEELLPRSSQALLRKSLALLEEPESSTKHFSHLVNTILFDAVDAGKTASSITRLNMCLWVQFSWCRDSGNLESSYLSAEHAVLLAWDKAKEHYTGRNKASKAFDSLLNTYLKITDEYVDHCILPYVELKHALSHAVHSPCSIDVNIKIFDVLGRLSVKGHWVLEALSKSYAANPPVDRVCGEQEVLSNRLNSITEAIKYLIDNNPMLQSPYKDSQAIDIGLALSLLSSNSKHDEFVKSWLTATVSMCIYTFNTNGMYPTVLSSYEQLLEHKHKDKADDSYKHKVTNGSVLYPLLTVFCALYKMDEDCRELESFTNEKLGHSTLQYWYPNQYSEEQMYTNSDMHGSASAKFPMGGDLVLKHIASECQNSGAFTEMSAVVQGKTSLVLTACRSYRYPVPFHILKDWLDLDV